MPYLGVAHPVPHHSLIWNFPRKSHSPETELLDCPITLWTSAETGSVHFNIWVSFQDGVVSMGVVRHLFNKGHFYRNKRKRLMVRTNHKLSFWVQRQSVKISRCWPPSIFRWWRDRQWQSDGLPWFAVCPRWGHQVVWWTSWLAHTTGMMVTRTWYVVVIPLKLKSSCLASGCRVSGKSFSSQWFQVSGGGDKLEMFIWRAEARYGRKLEEFRIQTNL